jgi:hypothetical protein
MSSLLELQRTNEVKCCGENRNTKRERKGRQNSFVFADKLIGLSKGNIKVWACKSCSKDDMMKTRNSHHIINFVTRQPIKIRI